MFVAGTNTTSLRMGSEFTAWSPRCMWSNRSTVAVPMHSEVTPSPWEISVCVPCLPVSRAIGKVCVWDYWLGCAGNVEPPGATGCFVSCWNVSAWGGVSSHAVSISFFPLSIIKKKKNYKICWIGLFKLFFHWKNMCFHCMCFVGEKKCFLKFLFNSCTEII